MQHTISIAVIGGGQCTPEEAALAEEVGREMAKRGASLICGGLNGVMEAACKGAARAGGLTIGVLPGDSAETANPYVRIPIVTGIGYARNQIVVKSARAVIAIGGAYGTLTELAYALQGNIPIVGLNTWHLSRNGKEEAGIVRAGTAAEAVEMAIRLAQGKQTGADNVQHRKG
ncbi:MAG: TIGR00725 family protein [Candidatus Thermoplasmatota archaeon]